MGITVDKRLNRHWKLFIYKWSLLLLVLTVVRHGFFSWGTSALLVDVILGVAGIGMWIVMRYNEKIALFVGGMLVNLVFATLIVFTAESNFPGDWHQMPAMLGSVLLWMPAVSLYWALLMYDKPKLVVLFITILYLAILFIWYEASENIQFERFIHGFSYSVLESTVILLLLLSFLRIHFEVLTRPCKKICSPVSLATDALTHLFSRSVFEDELQKNAQTASYYDATFSLMIIGVDKFKQYNTAHGHDFGDEALRTIAEVIKVRIRNIDVACRWGGEVFAIILPMTSIQGAVMVAESLREDIERISARQGRPLTVSIGVCEQKKDEYPGATFQRADNALKLAKQRGHNQVVASGATAFAWEETHFYI